MRQRPVCYLPDFQGTYSERRGFSWSDTKIYPGEGIAGVLVCHCPVRVCIMCLAALRPEGGQPCAGRVPGGPRAHSRSGKRPCSPWSDRQSLSLWVTRNSELGGGLHWARAGLLSPNLLSGPLAVPEGKAGKRKLLASSLEPESLGRGTASRSFGRPPASVPCSTLELVRPCPPSIPLAQHHTAWPICPVLGGADRLHPQGSGPCVSGHVESPFPIPVSHPRTLLGWP